MKKREPLIRSRAGHKLFEVEDLWHFDGADLRGASLSGFDLTGFHAWRTDLTDADLSGSDLYWCGLYETRFERADLRGTRFNGGFLEQVDFSFARLQGADFGLDNLSGMTWIEACDFNCAEYDSATVWPAGFDPQLAGMIEVS